MIAQVALALACVALFLGAVECLLILAGPEPQDRGPMDLSPRELLWAIPPGAVAAAIAVALVVAIGLAGMSRP